MGGQVVSCDELTAIQALEQIAPTQPMQAGQVERREFEYIRHGTLSLISNFDVASGQVISPSLGPTRTEADFAAHIARTLDTDPEAVWIFVTDQLNIHQSESLVRLVAERCGLNDELSVKGQTGILQSLATRAAYLQDGLARLRPHHRSGIRAVLVGATCGLWFGQPDHWPGCTCSVQAGDEQPGVELCLLSVLQAHRVRQECERAKYGLSWQEHGLIFASENGTPIQPSNLSRHFRQLRVRAGLSTAVHIHSLRHTVASQLGNLGVSKEIIKAILGHSDSDVTDRYIHIGLAPVRVALVRLEVEVISKQQ